MNHRLIGSSTYPCTSTPSNRKQAKTLLPFLYSKIKNENRHRPIKIRAPRAHARLRRRRSNNRPATAPIHPRGAAERYTRFPDSTAHVGLGRADTSSRGCMRPASSRLLRHLPRACAADARAAPVYTCMRARALSRVHTAPPSARPPRRAASGAKKWRACG